MSSDDVLLALAVLVTVTLTLVLTWPVIMSVGSLIRGGGS